VAGARKAEKEAAVELRRKEQAYVGVEAGFHQQGMQLMFDAVLKSVCQNRQLTAEQREARQKRMEAIQRKRGRDK
jgi:hypothetical protein